MLVEVAQGLRWKLSRPAKHAREERVEAVA
jgi:hypothetical protein